MTPVQLANIARAKEHLARMPLGVFEIYIQPLVLSAGWPFETLDDPTVLPWLNYFDGHSVKTISQLSWKRHEMPFIFAVFHPLSKERIRGIIDTHVRGVDTDFANIPNGRERFFGPRQYIARTFRLPEPVILMQDPLGLRILDGNHRLAAMASFPNSNDGIVDCWIGSR